jgi:hypothetical protein
MVRGYLCHFTSTMQRSHKCRVHANRTAWGLVKSPKRELQTEGIKLLQGGSCVANTDFTQLSADDFATLSCHDPEIYSSVPSHRRECTYYIAMGYYKLGNYGHARKFNGECFPSVVDGRTTF